MIQLDELIIKIQQRFIQSKQQQDIFIQTQSTIISNTK
ncbi:hypothetical protein pb186bvf_011577 [Paramecium bursaria]